MSTNPNIVWAETRIGELESEVADLRAYIRVERSKQRGFDAPAAPLPTSSNMGFVPAPSTSILRPSKSIVHYPGEGWATPLPNHGRKKTAMLLALASTIKGLRTQEIIAACTSGGIEGMTVENTSPQLSAYKADELIDLKDGVWTITTKGMDYLGDRGSLPEKKKGSVS